MNTEAVLARLTLLTEDTRESLLSLLAEDAVREVEACLLEDASLVLRYDDALTALAAAEAAVKLALLDEAMSPARVTAGDVHAAFNKGHEEAEQYAALCRRAAAPALTDNTFSFRRVSG